MVGERVGVRCWVFRFRVHGVQGSGLMVAERGLGDGSTSSFDQPSDVLFLGEGRVAGALAPPL